MMYREKSPILFIDNEKAYEYPYRDLMAYSYIIFGKTIDKVLTWYYYNYMDHAPRTQDPPWKVKV